MSAHKFPCPACGLLLKLPGIAPGKKAKCPQCQGTFTVPEAVTASASAAGTPPPRKAPGTMPGVGPRPGEEKRPVSSPPTAAPAIRKTAPTIPGISLPALENPLSIPDKAPPPAAPKISCPLCQKLLRSPPGLPPGKSIRCPHCTGVFPLPGEAKTNGVASVPVPSLPATAPTPPVPPPVGTPQAAAAPPAAPAKCEAPPKINVPKSEPEPRKPEPEPIISEALPETSISEQPLAPDNQSATETVDATAPASARRLKRVTCPECGTRLKPAKPVRVGRKITCAKCAVVFTVPDDASAITTEEPADQPPSEAEMHLDDDDEMVPSEKRQVAALAQGPQTPLLRLAWSLVALAGGFLIGSIVLFVLVEMGVFTKNAPAIPIVNAEASPNPAPPAADPVAVAPVGSWREFTFDDRGFTVEMPGSPKERVRKDPEGNEYRDYIIQSNDGRFSYALSTVDYSRDQTIDGLQRVTVDTPQGVAARNKIIDKKDAVINGYPGIEIIGEGSSRDGTAMVQTVRAYIVKNRLYKLSTASPKEATDEAGQLRFLDSFKIHEPPFTPEQRAAYDQERRVLKSIRDHKVEVGVRRVNDQLHVTLAGRDVKDEYLAQLPTLSNMTLLRLEQTPITDAGLAHLKGPAALAEIDLRSTAIGDLGIKHLKELTGLKVLGLGGTRIGDAGLAHLPVFTELQHLGLGDNPRIGDAGVAHLGKLAKLTLLALYNTGVGDAGVEHLKGLKELEYLDLSGTKVTDAGLAHLNALPRLTTLKLNRTRVTDAGVQLLLKNHPALRIER